MVGGIHQAGTIVFEAVAERQRRVVQILGADADLTRLEHPLHELMIADFGAKLLDCIWPARVSRRECERPRGA
jgi:hypothetical protein